MGEERGSWLDTTCFSEKHNSATEAAWNEQCELTPPDESSSPMKEEAAPANACRAVHARLAEA